MVYTVNESSPTRYLVRGSESDSDEDNYDEMENLKTADLAKDILNNPKSYVLELEIKFKNPYKRGEVTRQTIKATKVEVKDSLEKIKCSFDKINNPVFFSYNHDARYSKATLFLTGPKVDNQRKAISVFRNYLETTKPGYTISSQNLKFRAALKVPTEKTLRKHIKPKACRKLLFGPDDVPAFTVYSLNDQLKTGAILQIDKAQATLNICQNKT